MASGKRVVVIGSGRTLAKTLQCIKTFNRSAPRIAAHIVGVIVDMVGPDEGSSRTLGEIADTDRPPQMASADINSPTSLEFIRLARPDIILSANNHQIIGAKLRAIPPMGAINFHNGPLPRYGGLNACTWAIYNGESEHGVAWHFVHETIDGGDVIARRYLPIAPDEKAITLIQKCIDLGIEVLMDILPGVLDGTCPRTPQVTSGRLYHFKRQIPNRGMLDFTWDHSALDRFVRSLTFHPFRNPLAYPTSYYRGRAFSAEKLSLVKTGSRDAPGTLVLAEKDALHIAVMDAVVSLGRLRDEHTRSISVGAFIEEYNVRPNTRVGQDLHDSRGHEKA
ncbi:MAG: formyltransferase family protein [Paracoccaceae bacterium]|uniref:methionyl-tRNA formyltransferase n=1 Tax=Roseibium sp. TaxID=1936156 RepID=UPI003299CD5C